MIIYALIRDHENLTEGTKLVFNKSLQRFETLDRDQFITNKESGQNPGLIVIYKVIERAAATRRVFVIPF